MGTFPTVREGDGIERPMFSPVSTYRPRVKYTDMGRVIEGGRVYRVNDSTAVGVSWVGWLYVSDDGRFYASPDRPSSNGEGKAPKKGSVTEKLARMRWVGGFTNRGEVIAYLRAHRDASSEWWEKAGREYRDA